MTKGNWAMCSPAEWLWESAPMRWRRTYAGRADQVTAARVFAASLFAGTGREDDVALVVAELASNAVLHTRSGEPGRGWFGLEVTLADVAYIGVTDLGGRCVPIFQTDRPGCELREGGRGLLTVSKLSIACGMHGSAHFGHTVWADMALQSGGHQVAAVEVAPAM
ncbi:ATP-binding protein [Actinomadura sp. 9N407]|uniref:ATP-binding protein n=1 Tax=Actinomadura sp. 9N407 TaxID=3375154 RepID=UPI0037BD479D